MRTCRGLGYYVDATGAHHCQCDDCVAKRAAPVDSIGECIYCQRCEAYMLPRMDKGDTLCSACGLVL